MRAGQRRRDGHDGYVGIERTLHIAQLIPASAHRTDVARIAAVIAERLAQQLHALRHGLLVDDSGRPHALDQFVKADNAVTLFEQVTQQLETQTADLDRDARALDLLSCRIDAQVVELVDGWNVHVVDGHCATS